MHRVLVAVLAAVDALVAVAVGLVAVLAPFTLLWIAAFGDVDAWDALWPATARVWQLGHLVPVHLDLGDAASLLGVPDRGAAFWVSIAPLLFACFTLIFAARSGARAAGSDAPIIGVVTGTAVIALTSGVVAVTSANPVASITTWQGVVLPAAVYAVGAAAGAVRAAWRDGDDGVIDRIHDAVDGWSPAWRVAPTLVVRGTATVVVGLIGAAALLLAALIALRGGEVINLFERAHVDLVGLTTLTLAQLAYIPTFIGWGVAWIAGPGFAIGADTAVSPSGTSLGVLPGVPMLGVIPEGGSGWALLIVLVPVALGALAGWIARRSYAEEWAFDGDGDERFAPRVAIAAGIAVSSGALAALIAATSVGSMGPGRLAVVGPDPGPVALTVGIEVLVGAAILLLAPVRRPLTWDDLSDDDADDADESAAEGGVRSAP